MSAASWLLWGVILIAQNFAFTFVSRARNSGSVVRHAIASVFSNGIWFTSQMYIFTAMYAMLVGKHGVKLQVFTALFYTSFTVIGALVGHYISLRTEKGKAAVGASKKYAQIAVDDWKRIYDHVANVECQVPKAAINLGPVTTVPAQSGWVNYTPQPAVAIPGQGAKV
jgi:hypothetical protein